MPLSETSSLEDSLARILGQPATPAAPAVNLAPATGLSYGGLDWGGLTNASTTQTGQPAAAASGGIITSESAPAAPAAAAPAAAPVAEPIRNSAGLTQQEFSDAINKTAAMNSSIMNPEAFKAGAIAGQFSTPENWTNYFSLKGLSGDALTNAANEAVTKYPSGSIAQETYGSYTPYSLNIIPAGSSSASTAAAAPARAPRNPGPKAPWQASQQYWKDLAAYNASIGK